MPLVPNEAMAQKNNNTTISRGLCQTSSTSLPNFVEYQNSTYGIKICYPSTWKVLDNQTDGYTNVHVVDFYAPRDTDHSCYPTCFPASLEIDIEPNVTENLDNYIADSVQGDRLDHYYNLTLLSTGNNANFLGRPGYEINFAYSCCGLNNELLHHEVGTIIADKAYFAVYSAAISLSSKHLETINKMINSLQIDIPQLNKTQILQAQGQPINSNVPEI